MSLLVRFSPEALTAEKHDEVTRRLNDAGHWPPDGMEYHVCFGESGQLRVSEIWSSAEQFEAFGEHLMPILGELGITMAGPPEVLEIYHQDRF